MAERYVVHEGDDLLTWIARIAPKEDSNDDEGYACEIGRYRTLQTKQKGNPV